METVAQAMTTGTIHLDQGQGLNDTMIETLRGENTAREREGGREGEREKEDDGTVG